MQEKIYNNNKSANKKKKKKKKKKKMIETPFSVEALFNDIYKI